MIYDFIEIYKKIRPFVKISYLIFLTFFRRIKNLQNKDNFAMILFKNHFLEHYMSEELNDELKIYENPTLPEVADFIFHLLGSWWEDNGFETKTRNDYRK